MTKNRKNNIKIITGIILVLILSICSNCNINAVSMSIMCDGKVNVGDTIDVKVDFGEYIAAYDLLEIAYTTRLLKYVPTNEGKENEELNSKFWFDTSQASDGIRYKTYKFKGLKDGKAIINANAKGLVSAGNTMNNLGDATTKKEIIVGTGIEKGDLNGDSSINSTDSALALDIFKRGNPTKPELEKGDLNADNIINSVDAALILDIFKDY